MSLLQNSNAISTAGGYNLTDSLRFRSSASASLERTPTTTGNQKTFTASFWIKRGLILDNVIMSSGEAGDGDADLLQFHLTNQSLRLATATTQLCLTNAVLRDPSSWYHVVLAVDTTQATASDRIKIYLNNVLLSFSASSMPAQNTNFGWNKASNRMKIARAYNDTGYFDGYMTEVNFVDGQALDPTSFGEYNEDTGVWQPIKYTGTYGTNGFYLKGRGTDNSGNGNNWTENNFNTSNSALTTYDIMSDVPTLTDEDTGNFATLNAIAKNGSSLLSNSNLTLETSGASASRAPSSIAMSSGKYYFECTRTDNSSIGNNVGVGVSNSTVALSTNDYIGNPTSSGAVSYEWMLTDRGRACNNSTYTNLSGTLGTIAAGDVVQVCVDMDTNSIWWGKNNTFVGSPSAGTGATFTNLPDEVVFVVYSASSSTAKMQANFGQRPFAYTPPTGFLKLNTYNLPDSAIKDGSQYMNPVLYTGDGTTDFSKSISLGFSPDFAWFKSRNSTENHGLYDTIRGGTNRLISNSTAAESTVNGIQFDSDGVNVYSSNTNLVNYVVWGWRGSDSTAVSNTFGTVTSTVSANTTAGFSVVLYTGNGGAMTVGHGLGVAPKMIILKDRDISRAWAVYHGSLATNQYLVLNTTAAVATSTQYWNNTAPTSTVFSVNGAEGNVAANGEKYVAYCFAEVEGFSKFGSYTGNGSTDGPFIYTGFRPAFIIVKDYSAVHNWWTWDSARNTYNAMNEALVPNLSVAEQTPLPVDFTSNGFKFRTSNGEMNQSGNNYIYMAFAESPFKNSLAR